MDRNATSSLPFLEAIRILPDGDEILKHIKYEVNNIECTSFLEIIKKKESRVEISARDSFFTICLYTILFIVV
jgi:hypothetical protein